VAKQLNSHILTTNTGEEIDLSRSKLIFGSVP